MRKVLVIGATSAIAQAVLRRFTERGDSMYIVGRNESHLCSIVQDVKVRGGHIAGSKSLDLNCVDEHSSLFLDALDALGGLDVVLIAHGSLGDQIVCELDYKKALTEIQTNFLSVVSILTPIINWMEDRRAGCICVISSVAGDRARKSNYIYGTSKGALSLFLQGARSRLFHSGVNVITLKLGFVSTPMTQHLKQGPLFVSPDYIAKGIMRAIDRKRDVVYLPGFWRLIMMLVSKVPEGLFKRLNL